MAEEPEIEVLAQDLRGAMVGRVLEGAEVLRTEVGRNTFFCPQYQQL